MNSDISRQSYPKLCPSFPSNQHIHKIHSLQTNLSGGPKREIGPKKRRGFSCRLARRGQEATFDNEVESAQKDMENGAEREEGLKVQFGIWSWRLGHRNVYF
jgi:hypothetical protein